MRRSIFQDELQGTFRGIDGREPELGLVRGCESLPEVELTLDELRDPRMLGFEALEDAHRLPGLAERVHEVRFRRDDQLEPSRPAQVVLARRVTDERA
ncbi:MAG: hypothetical protein IPJ77_09765 [Planctomycetes bacterium]|nr:hypothetical protein [Planctomycetota bacterium]